MKKLLFLCLVVISSIYLMGNVCAQPEVVEEAEAVEESPSFLDELEVLKAEFKPLVLWSLTENQVTYATGLQLLGYKGAELDLAYSTDKDLIALALGYEINYLEKFGVDVPWAKYVTASVGGFIGSRDFTSEDRSSDMGVWFTPFKLKFD